MKLKQISKRSLSIALVVLMVISTMIVGTITAFAFDLQGTYNFDNYTAKWDKVYLVKIGNDGQYTEYSEMTDSGNGIYTYNLGSWGGTSFYFANSNSNPTATTQRCTSEVDSTNNCFVPSSAAGTNISGTWTTTAAAIGAHQSIDTSASPTDSTEAAAQPTTQPTASAPTTDNVVYVQNDAGWSKVCCYMWLKGTENNNKGWPGANMTDLGDGIWCYEVPNNALNMIIFNPGGDEGKTGDMSYPGTGHIYNNKTGKWDVYDSKPLRITSFTTDLASPQYTGVEIAISANAKSSDGAVSYRFTATSSVTGTTVILSDYGTANSVVWTPSVVGGYVITVDVKDAAGNENKRTMNYTVADPSSLVKPLIMAVKPGNNGQIQVNTTATVNVTAGGGNTGTKLLFYKYVVTDPDGVKNIPYYSLNSTYQLTPAKLGKYTVQVYVQGSDNQTVNKSYTYDSVGEVVPTVPTSAPVTIPSTAPVTEPSTDSSAPATEPATVPKFTYTDDKTSIAVITDVDAELVVEKKTDSASIEKANAALGADEKLVELFDISLAKNGVTVQPDSSATVRIPSDKPAKIYRIEDDGTKTNMNAVFVDSYLEFTTGHFSLYAVTEGKGSILGDVNCDGELNVKDAATIQLHLAKLLSDADPFDYLVADYDRNGDVNIKDAAAIQLHLAHLD